MLKEASASLPFPFTDLLGAHESPNVFLFLTCLPRVVFFQDFNLLKLKAGDFGLFFFLHQMQKLRLIRFNKSTSVMSNCNVNLPPTPDLSLSLWQVSCAANCSCHANDHNAAGSWLNRKSCSHRNLHLEGKSSVSRWWNGPCIVPPPFFLWRSLIVIIIVIAFIQPGGSIQNGYLFTMTAWVVTMASWGRGVGEGVKHSEKKQKKS